MTTTNDLMNDVSGSFLGAAGQNPAASALSMIVFEQLAITPGLTTGAVDSQEAADEYVFQQADQLPDISTGVYLHTLRSLSFNYNELLNPSLPCSQQSAPLFNAAKAAAQQAYDNNNPGTASLGNYFPAYAVPKNWYDPSQQANWKTYTYPPPAPASTTPPASSSSSSGITPPPPLRLQTPVATWRLVAQRPNPELVDREPVRIGSNPVINPTFRIAGPGVPVARDIISPIARAPIAVDHPILTFHPQPTATPPPPPTLQPEFTMSFDYCIVRLTRPWLSGDFLATPDWYVPQTTGGSFSGGPSPASPAKLGPLSFIATAFIATKSLSINASAIADSTTSTGTLTSFGPFPLTGSTAGSGIQIIGWICEQQPLLPPVTDPALIPAPAPAPSAPVLLATAAGT